MHPTRSAHLLAARLPATLWGHHSTHIKRYGKDPPYINLGLRITPMTLPRSELEHFRWELKAKRAELRGHSSTDPGDSHTPPALVQYSTGLP